MGIPSNTWSRPTYIQVCVPPRSWIQKREVPIAFIRGDAFDPKHLKVVPPLLTANAPTVDTVPPALDLRSLTSLNPLHGRVAAIHASSFFHLFREEKQLHLARALAGLLSPEPGSIIFGLHVALAEKGFTTPETGVGHRLFCHSPVTWAQLWDGEVFEKGVVNVQTKLVEVVGKSILGVSYQKSLSEANGLGRRLLSASYHPILMPSRTKPGHGAQHAAQLKRQG